MNSSTTRLLRSFAIAIVLTLVGAFVVDLGVTGGDTSDTGSSGAVGDAGSGAGATIEIVDFAFEPATLRVKVGDTITVVNRDDAKHTVTSGERDAPDGTFDVVVEGGETEIFTITESGSYPYICTIHPGMKGSIEVTE